MNKTIERCFGECAEEILDSDLLLFRSRGLISVFGRSIYSHAGKAAWWNGRLFLLEVREFYGGRAVLLESCVKKYSGRIDVFRANPDNRWPSYRRDKAVEIMQCYAGCDYGYKNVLSAAFSHLPGIRFFTRPCQKDVPEIEELSRPPFCSQACAIADRVGGGIDPVPHLADRFTEPGDLARSVFYKYIFTLK